MINTQTANKNHYVKTYNRPLINNSPHQQQANQQQTNHIDQRASEPVKTMPKNQANPSINEQSQQIKRNFICFVHIYAILTISLYVTYAAYYFYQHQLKRNQQQFQAIDISSSTTAPEDLIQMSSSEQQHLRLTQSDSSDEFEQRKLVFESKFETKIHLLERYIELIAIDLQETKNRLKEREKCDCSLSCTFNGTKYAEHSSWQSQCDVCTCQLGRISCLPKKCPPTNCDDAIQLPGQCCPTCMKKCKHNNTIVRHGHKLKPSESSGKSTKECKCYDGRIKCEQLPIQRFSTNPKDIKSRHPFNSTSAFEAKIVGENRSKQLNTTNILKASSSTNLIDPSILTHPLQHKAQPPPL